MPRNRMIKPEFWTSEQVLNCSPMARLLFIGLWNYSDDNGVHPASYKKLKAEVFPSDDYSTKEIQSWISELIQQGLLSEYVIADKTYWMATGWKKHQTIKYPTYIYPIQFINEKQPTSMTESSRSIDGTFPQHCSMASSPLMEEYGNIPPQIKINNIKENKEKHIREVNTSPVGVCESNHDAGTQLFKYWQSTMNHPHAKLDKKRRAKIEQALNLGYSILELQKAIDGCKNTPYNMGKNDSGQIYDDISLIFRDATHIERFIHNADNASTAQDETIETNFMMEVL